MKEELTGLVAQLPALGDRTVVLYAEKLLYRAEEAADCLGLSRTKVYELIHCGILPAVKVDGCRRVRRDDLRAFVESLREIA
jgi:excisionase family DNA binding protein